MDFATIRSLGIPGLDLNVKCQVRSGYGASSIASSNGRLKEPLGYTILRISVDDLNVCYARRVLAYVSINWVMLLSRSSLGP